MEDGGDDDTYDDDGDDDDDDDDDEDDHDEDDEDDDDDDDEDDDDDDNDDDDGSLVPLLCHTGNDVLQLMVSRLSTGYTGNCTAQSNGDYTKP